MSDYAVNDFFQIDGNEPPKISWRTQPTNAPITIAINGTLTVSRAELERLIRPMLTATP